MVATLGDRSGLAGRLVAWPRGVGEAERAESVGRALRLLLVRRDGPDRADLQPQLCLSTHLEPAQMYG